MLLSIRPPSTLPLSTAAPDLTEITETASGGASGGGAIIRTYSSALSEGTFVYDSFWDSGYDLANHIADTGQTWNTSAGNFEISLTNGQDLLVSQQTSLVQAVIESSHSNLSVAATFTLDATTAGFVGVIFRWFNTINYYSVQVEQANAALRLLETTGGTTNQLAFAVVNLELGGTYTLNVYAKGTTVIVDLDGAEITYTTANDFTTSTPVGLFLSNSPGSGTGFTRFEATVPTTVITSTGGALVSGSATPSHVTADTGNGGALASGNPDADIQHPTFTEFFPSAGGGALAGGTALNGISPAIGGGALGSGTASPTMRFNPVVSGGTLAGTTAIPTANYSPANTGGVLAGGFVIANEMIGFAGFKTFTASPTHDLTSFPLAVNFVAPVIVKRIKATDLSANPLPCELADVTSLGTTSRVYAVVLVALSSTASTQGLIYYGDH